MIQSARNNIIATLKTKWVGNFSDILRNSQLDPNSSANPADLVQIVGEVVSVPKSVISRVDYEGFSVDGIRPGDTLVFRFDVVFSFLRQPANDTPVYKNSFWYAGKEYWAVDVQKAFAIIREGEITMLNGYVMVAPIEKAQAIILPQHMKRLLKSATTTVMHIGRPKVGHKEIPVKNGDIVEIHPQKVQKYQINGKPFCIIKQTDILGLVESLE